jgi:hypothetical protein
VSFLHKFQRKIVSTRKAINKFDAFRIDNFAGSAGSVGWYKLSRD